MTKITNPEQLQFLRDVMCTAFEGGCAYWAEARRVRRDGELNYLSFDIRAVEEHDEDRLRVWQSITPAKLDVAIRKLISGEHKAAKYIVDQFAGYPGNLDATDHDADGADVVVQLAAFGEIVFG